MDREDADGEPGGAQILSDVLDPVQFRQVGIHRGGAGDGQDQPRRTFARGAEGAEQ